MRRLAFILIFLVSALTVSADNTDYYCVVCGKGPLTGRIWMSKWGPVCNDCYKLEEHCSICGLPVKEGDGHIKTGDGRFICRFDKPNVVLDAAEARQIFADARRDLMELFGQGFALQYPEVTVNLFDVDYWSEKGQPDSLHKFGFASTRRLPSGKCTHEVVILSGRLREEVAATTAHEYTHLWINENCPRSHVIDGDTVEAICELSAYKLMEDRNLPDMQKRLLENPYTHGKIKTLVEIEKQRGIGYILNWVKNGTGADLEQAAFTSLSPQPVVTMTFTNVVHLPTVLKLKSIIWNGRDSRVIVNGVSLATGDIQPVKLQGRTVNVHCLAIHPADAVLEVGGRSQPVTLKMGEEIVP